MERIERFAQPVVSGALFLPVKWYLKWKLDLHFEGIENIPRKGPCLIAAKQNFNYDGLLVGISLWSNRMTARYVMRDLYLPLPFREIGVFVMGCLGARRILRKREVLKGKGSAERRQLLLEARERIIGESSYLAVEAAQSGHLCFFPEGTRSLGKMSPFRRELFESALSLDQDVTILPVGIEYPDEKTVHVRYGEPFPCVGELDAVVSRCHEDIRRLSGL
jgi:1-acyl-sn-glycerol-3-phosphate acyltransferase